MPASESTLSRFTVLKTKSVGDYQVYLSAVCHVYIQAGYPATLQATTHLQLIVCSIQKDFPQEITLTSDNIANPQEFEDVTTLIVPAVPGR